MANLRSPRFQLLLVLQVLVLIQSKVLCYQYKVGDLDAWGVPTSTNPQVYTKWSKTHEFKMGDSLCKSFLFLSFNIVLSFFSFQNH